MEAQQLGQVVRMQEEIGTGGAGFRFIFAAFIQEAAAVLKQDALLQISQEITDAGDVWRNFAFMAGRICKGRHGEGESYEALGGLLMDCAEREKKIFKELKKIVF